MKNLFIIFFALFSITLFSCKKSVLDEVNQSGITADPFYSTATGMEALVNTCYAPMRFWYGKEGGATLTELGTDLFVKGGDNKHPEIATYDPVNLNSQNPLMKVYWDRFYAAVNACNAAIARLDASPLTPAVKKLRNGEIHFLRAMYYWLIVENWGGVHLTTEESRGVITTANKTPVDEFYKLIFSDLDIAITELEARTKTEGGRVTKPAAEAFKARLLLTRGQYQEAATLAKKVISGYSFKLADDYASIWDIANSNGSTNAEVIWFVNYTADNLLNPDIPTYDGNSQANAFRSEGGNQLHMMFTPRYDFHSGMLIDIGNDVGFQRYATTKRLLTLYNDEIDQRYEGTFKEVWKSNGGPIGAYTEMKTGDTAIYWSHKALPAAFKQARAKRFEILDINDLYNANQSLKDNRNFIEMHKHNDPNRSGIFEFRSKRDAFVMRIAEMYLIVAEASMMANNMGDAVQYMNMLRTKRAKPGKESAMTISAADMNIDFILEERARELVGEQLRWFDLKRTNKLVEYVQKYNPDGAANIKAHHMLRPIPQSQLDAVSNKGEFTQNEGYN
jgi:hypothetical protein